MIKFLYLDGMNVLLHKKVPESFYFEKELGIPQNKYEQVIYDVVKIQGESMTNEFWTLATLDQEIDYMNRYHVLLCKHLNIEPKPELIARLTQYRVFADYELAPNALETIKKLSIKVKIGILSNAMPSRRYHELKIDNIDQYFSTIILSREVGFFKPVKQIYEIAEQKSGVKTGEIMFVDDKEKYLDGAASIGWERLYLFGSEKSEKYENLITFEEIADIINR
jgi:HAD superfamily hydrolase (TIGR01509 family)